MSSMSSDSSGEYLTEDESEQSFVVTKNKKKNVKRMVFSGSEDDEEEPEWNSMDSVGLNATAGSISGSISAESSATNNDSNQLIQNETVAAKYLLNAAAVDLNTAPEEEHESINSMDSIGLNVTRDSLHSNNTNVHRLSTSVYANNEIEDSEDEVMEAQRQKAMEERRKKRSSRRLTVAPNTDLISDSDDDEIQSSFIKKRHNQVLSEDEEIIPETDEELEESRIQTFSPSTRMSIGRVPRNVSISDSEEGTELEPIEHDDVGNLASFHEQIATDAASINPNKRTRRNILNSTIGDGNKSLTSFGSATNTPIAKRQSMVFNENASGGSVNDSNSIIPAIKSENSIVSVSEKEDAPSVEVTGSILIDDDSVDSSVHVSEKNVIEIVSSEDESLRFSSTPNKPKVLVQPKLHFQSVIASNVAKHVSQEYYDKVLHKLNDVANQLKTSEELYSRTKNSLPDNGINLCKRIEGLKKDQVKIKIELQNLIVAENEPVEIKKPPVVKTWADIEAGTRNILPKFHGEQGINTFNDQKNQVLSRLHDLHSALEKYPDPDTLADTPYSLRVQLMRHQRYGLAWMIWRERQKLRGGILADDMGLGKTLSVIALILACNEQQNEDEKTEESSENEDDEDDYLKDLYYGGTLVVAPASLIAQWESEVERRVKRNSISILLHHGNNRETSARRVSKYDLVITTYGLVSSEAKNRGPMHQIKWERIVLDEAHVIRNHSTSAALACCKLKGVKRWALTGTPVQNKEMDIFSLLKFLRCSPFNELPIFKKWMNTNTEGGRERLAGVLKPLLLRRTKAELQMQGELVSLPTKKINTVQFKFSKEEKNVYSKILSFSKVLFAQYIEQRANRQHMNNMGLNTLPPYARNKEPNDAYSRVHEKFNRVKAFNGEVKSHVLLVLITRLRQLCNHPGLIEAMLEDDNQSGDSDDESPELDLLEEMNKLTLTNGDENDNIGDEHAIHRVSSKALVRSNPVFDFKTRSSKCNEVLRVVKDILENTEDKVVIVSQWTAMLNIIARFLREDGIRYTELTGQTQIKLRNGIVDSFNSSGRERVLLLSLVAGGVGLNLAGANHLVLVDPHWNPQLEAQAADRVYRVGQTKPVQIYKLLCDDTIEARIKEMQDHKLALSEHVLTGSKDMSSKLNLEDMKKLFDM